MIFVCYLNACRQEFLCGHSVPIDNLTGKSSVVDRSASAGRTFAFQDGMNRHLRDVEWFETGPEELQDIDRPDNIL